MSELEWEGMDKAEPVEGILLDLKNMERYKDAIIEDANAQYEMMQEQLEAARSEVEQLRAQLAEAMGLLKEVEYLEEVDWIEVGTENHVTGVHMECFWCGASKGHEPDCKWAALRNE